MISFIKFITQYNIKHSKRYFKLLSKSNNIFELSSRKEIRPFLSDLFLNRFNLDLIDYPELASEKQLFQANQLADKLKNVFLDNADSCNTDNTIEKFAKLGVLSIISPPTDDGAGLNKMQLLRVFENFHLNFSSALSVLIPQYLVIEALSLWGCHRVKEKYLTKLLDGQVQGLLCIREEINNKLVPSAFKTRAILSDDKSCYRLNGMKTNLVNVDKSKVLLVFAGIDSPDKEDNGRCAAFIIDANSPGVSFVMSQNQNTSLHNMTNTDVVLTNVTVPIENMVGNVDQGPEMSRRAIMSENVLVSAISMGMHKHIMTQYIQFANARHVFGVPLISYENIKVEAVKLTTDLYFSESVAYFIAGHMDQDANRDLVMESAITKVVCVESLSNWTDKFLVMLGHNGLNDDLPYVINQHQSEYLMFHQPASVDTRLLVARMCIDHLLTEPNSIEFHPLKQLLCILGLQSDIVYTSTDSTVSAKLSRYLHPKAEFLTHIVFLQFRKILVYLNGAQKKYGKVLLDDRLFLHRISQIIINLWTMVVSISRISRSLCLNLPTNKHQLNLITMHFSTFISNLDSEFDSLTDHCKNKYDNVSPCPHISLNEDHDRHGIPHPFNI